MNLYQCFDIDEVTPIQFVGVYVTRWRPAWGEPTVMFREVEDSEALALAAQLPEVRALVEALRDAVTICTFQRKRWIELDLDVSEERVHESWTKQIDRFTATLAPFEGLSDV